MYEYYKMVFYKANIQTIPQICEFGHFSMQGEVQKIYLKSNL